MQLLKDVVWIVTAIAIPLATYFIGKYRNIKENDSTQTEAIKMLLQNNLTNIAYVYLEIGEIPDYVYKGWLNQFGIYKRLGGNDYCDELHTRMEKLRIKNTNILK